MTLPQHECGCFVLKFLQNLFSVHLLYSTLTILIVSPNSYTEKKGRPRKTKRGGGAGGGGGRREPRLSPLHESALAGGQRTAVSGGIRPIVRGRSASEYIPRSKGKDHLPEIPAMNVKPSADEARSSSLSGKVGASTTTPTSPTTPVSVSIATPTATATAAEHRSPSRDTTDGPITEEALEASVDFARNVRGTSTPIDVSPDLGNNNRSQTFNGVADTSDRKPPTTNGAPDTVDLADSIDTQQIELSLGDGSEGHSNAHSTGGAGVAKAPPIA